MIKALMHANRKKTSNHATITAIIFYISYFYKDTLQDRLGLLIMSSKQHFDLFYKAFQHYIDILCIHITYYIYTILLQATYM